MPDLLNQKDRAQLDSQKAQEDYIAEQKRCRAPLLMFSAFMIQEEQIWDSIWMPFRRGRSQHLEGSEGSRVTATGKRVDTNASHMHTNLVRGGRAGLPKDWTLDVTRITTFADRESSPPIDAMKFAFRYDLKTVARWNGLGDWEAQPDDGIRPIEMRENTPFWVEAVIPTLFAHEHPTAAQSRPPYAQMNPIFARLDRKLANRPIDVLSDRLAGLRAQREETLKEMASWQRVAGQMLVWVVLEGTGSIVVI